MDHFHIQMQELSKEENYKTSIEWLGDNELLLSFYSAFLYQLPALSIRISHDIRKNTLVLETGQVYYHWFPLANDLYAGHINLDTLYFNSISYDISIKSVDQDSLRMFTISGSRAL